MQAQIGGATGRVGDPGGRTAERDLMAQDLVDTNAISITKQIEQFFHQASQFARKRRTENPRTAGALRHESAALKENNVKIKVLNNLSWHSNLSMLSFLRFPGKLLRVNALLTRESVKARLSSSQGTAYFTPTRKSGTDARFQEYLMPNSPINYFKRTTFTCFIEIMAWICKLEEAISGETLLVV
jgi:tyrosyl-tRNA synthetase